MVELLVVIGIIAILMGLLIPATRRASQQSRATACGSNLRQLYLAQSFYADDNAGRLAGVEYKPGTTWVDRLSRYLSPRADLRRELQLCAELDVDTSLVDALGAPRMAYGVNSCTQLPEWQSRRDRRMPSSEIILMADKLVTTADWLTTDDGAYAVYLTPTAGHWLQSTLHNSRPSYRHAGRANVVMADGHVRALTPDRMVRTSGHWYWKDPQLAVYQLDTDPCCGGPDRPEE